MSLLYFQSHNAVSFNLEHINILFHAFSTCSSGPLCPFIYLCFCPRNILIQNRQFYFDSYLYVKCGGGACRCSCTLLFAEAAFFSPRIVQDILSVDQMLFFAIHSQQGRDRKYKIRVESTLWQLTRFQITFSSLALCHVNFSLFCACTCKHKPTHYQLTLLGSSLSSFTIV